MRDASTEFLVRELALNFSFTFYYFNNVFWDTLLETGDEDASVSEKSKKIWLVHILKNNQNLIK